MIKWVEMDTLRSAPRIFACDAIKIEGLNPEGIAELIKESLEKSGCRSRSVNCAFLSPQNNHYILSLPPMSKPDMNALIKRSIIKETNQDISAFAFDFAIVNSAGEKGKKKNEVLVAQVMQSDLDYWLNILKMARLEPSLITVPPLALLSYLKFTRVDFGNLCLLFLYLGEKNDFVSVYEGGILRFSREFRAETGTVSLPHDYPEAEKPISRRAITEINRSILYYHQHFRGRTIEKVIAESYSRQKIGEIKEILEQELKIPVEVNQLLSPALSSSDLSPEAFFPWAIPVGLARREIKTPSINVIPFEIQEKRPIFLKKAAFAAALLGAISVLGFSNAVLSRSINTLEKKIGEREKIRDLLQPEAKLRNDANRSRKEREKQKIFLRESKISTEIWLGRLKELSLIVPDEMIFTSFNLEVKKNEKERVIIKGKVLGVNAASAQVIFNKFFQDLRESPFFQDIYSPVTKISPFQDRLNPALPQGGDSRYYNLYEAMLEFEIEGAYWKGERLRLTNESE